MKSIRVVEFPPDKLEPLFVAGRHVPQIILGLSAKTLANWRCQKIGPAYHIVMGVPYYEWHVLKTFFSQGYTKTN